jgi:hypothetical protein
VTPIERAAEIIERQLKREDGYPSLESFITRESAMEIAVSNEKS